MLGMGAVGHKKMDWPRTCKRRGSTGQGEGRRRGYKKATREGWPLIMRFPVRWKLLR